MPNIGRVGIRFGKPMDFSRYAGMENDRFVLRSITDEIMYELMRLSGQEYVDVYASKAKSRDRSAQAALPDHQDGDAPEIAPLWPDVARSPFDELPLVRRRLTARWVAVGAAAVRVSMLEEVEPCESECSPAAATAPASTRSSGRVVRKGIERVRHEFVGFRDGWRGADRGATPSRSTSPQVRGILPRGGTILGILAHQPVPRSTAASSAIAANLDELGIDALVAIGGEDTLGVATQLADSGSRSSACRRPSTTTSSATDYTFGFDTAVNIATEAIDRLHTTAESHHRALVVEVMGRHAGWIALHAGLAGGANVILIPEVPFDIEQVVAYVEHRFESHYAPIIVVAEGATPAEGTMRPVAPGELDAFGHVRLGGIGQRLADELEKRTGNEVAHHVLGHVQRGGTPTAFDRVLATRFGLHAIDAVHEGDFGQMVALRGTDIVRVAAGRGDRRAQDRAAGALRRGRGLLRLTPIGPCG